MVKERLIELRRRLHQIPEPGFCEFETQKLLLEEIAKFPSDRLEVESWKTAILVKVNGTNPRRIIGYRTDMDGLPLEEATSYDFKSRHPGFMHACGHDMHMAIAMGVLDHFVYNPIQDDLLIIFQPAEEGPGGAKPIMETEIFKRWTPEQIYALHVAPEYPVGSIAVRPGLLFANATEFHITLTGKEGHAAYPHTAIDTVLALSQLLSQLHTVVSRDINPLDSAVVTIGRVEAGTRNNIIAGSARIEGTLRTLTHETNGIARARIEEICKGVELSYRCKSEIEWVTEYCRVFNDENSTNDFVRWLGDNTSYKVEEAPISMGGEDFGYFLSEIPGFMFWLGADADYALHHPKIEPKEEALSIGVEVVTRYLTHISSAPTLDS